MANIFPSSANSAPLKIVVGALLVLCAVVVGFAYYFPPAYSRVGYAPTQPVPFSHAIHVEQLGMDCRYCHTNVEVSSHSNVPDAATCMNCHNQIKNQSVALAPIRDQYAGGEGTGPNVEWVRIHQAPDYVYFNHAAHVNRGVSCVHCHGQINEMEVVHHAKELSMGWCLECHRQPEKFLRPLEHIYDLKWSAGSAEAQLALGRQLKEEWNVNPPLSCSGCHR